MAHRVRRVIGASPVLLLTATPIQNSLRELWGLVQYVDPTGTLLGDKPVFEDVFCADDGRGVAAHQAEELRGRLATVVQRTLRRQAREFLDRPFVGRRAQLFEYRMSADERALYDDVTDYLLSPTLHAFRGNARQLLLLGFHRRMASSIPALAESLDKVASRLRGMLGEGDAGATAAAEFVRDLEEEDDIGDGGAGTTSAPMPPAARRGRGDPNRTRTGRGLRAPRPCAAAGQQGGEPRAGSAHGHGPAGGPAQGRDLHRVPDDPGLPARAPARTDGTARRGHHAVPGQQRLAARPGSPRRVARRQRPGRPDAERVGGRAPGARRRVPPALDGPDLVGSGGERAEPAVLRHRHQLRPAVEPAADRAAHRPLPPLRADARRHRHQLSRPRQPGAAAYVRHPQHEARSVRRRPSTCPTSCCRRRGPMPPRSWFRRWPGFRGRTAPDLGAGALGRGGGGGTAPPWRVDGRPPAGPRARPRAHRRPHRDGPRQLGA